MQNNEVVEEGTHTNSGPRKIENLSDIGSLGNVRESPLKKYGGKEKYTCKNDLEWE
jgi:hypothetical protein